jgi:hypothetical protein
MAQKVFVLMLALTMSVAWIAMSAAQPAPGQVLRVFTTTVGSVAKFTKHTTYRHNGRANYCYL